MAGQTGLETIDFDPNLELTLHPNNIHKVLEGWVKLHCTVIAHANQASFWQVVWLFVSSWTAEVMNPDQSLTWTHPMRLACTSHEPSLVGLRLADDHESETKEHYILVRFLS